MSSWDKKQFTLGSHTPEKTHGVEPTNEQKRFAELLEKYSDEKNLGELANVETDPGSVKLLLEKIREAYNKDPKGSEFISHLIASAKKSVAISETALQSPALSKPGMATAKKSLETKRIQALEDIRIFEQELKKAQLQEAKNEEARKEAAKKDAEEKKRLKEEEDARKKAEAEALLAQQKKEAAEKIEAYFTAQQNKKEKFEKTKITGGEQYQKTLTDGSIEILTVEKFLPGKRAEKGKPGTPPSVRFNRVVFSPSGEPKTTKASETVDRREFLQNVIAKEKFTERQKETGAKDAETAVKDPEEVRGEEIKSQFQSIIVEQESGSVATRKKQQEFFSTLEKEVPLVWLETNLPHYKRFKELVTSTNYVATWKEDLPKQQAKLDAIEFDETDGKYYRKVVSGNTVNYEEVPADEWKRINNDISWIKERIDTEEINQLFTNAEKKLNALKTKGNETLYVTDPETGEETPTKAYAAALKEYNRLLERKAIFQKERGITGTPEQEAAVKELQQRLDALEPELTKLEQKQQRANEYTPNETIRLNSPEAKKMLASFSGVLEKFATKLPGSGGSKFVLDLEASKLMSPASTRSNEIICHFVLNKSKLEGSKSWWKTDEEKPLVLNFSMKIENGGFTFNQEPSRKKNDIDAWESGSQKSQKELQEALRGKLPSLIEEIDHAFKESRNENNLPRIGNLWIDPETRQLLAHYGHPTIGFDPANPPQKLNREEELRLKELTKEYNDLSDRVEKITGESLNDETESESEDPLEYTEDNEEDEVPNETLETTLPEGALGIERVRQEFEQIPGFEQVIEILGENTIENIAKESTTPEEFLEKVEQLVTKKEQKSYYETAMEQKSVSEFFTAAREKLGAFEDLVARKLDRLLKEAEAERTAPPSLEKALWRINSETKIPDDLKKTLGKLLEEYWEKIQKKDKNAYGDVTDQITAELRELQRDPLGTIRRELLWEFEANDGSGLKRLLNSNPLRNYKKRFLTADRAYQLSRQSLLEKDDGEFLASLAILKDDPRYSDTTFIKTGIDKFDLLGGFQSSWKFVREESSSPVLDRVKNIDQKLNPFRYEVLKNIQSPTLREKIRENTYLLTLLQPRDTRYEYTFTLESFKRHLVYWSSWERPESYSLITACGFELKLLNREDITSNENIDIQSSKAEYQLISPDGITLEKKIVGYDAAYSALEQQTSVYVDRIFLELHKEK